VVAIDEKYIPRKAGNHGPQNPTFAWQGKQGFQFEQPLGLQYVRHRWYDPATRQFISPDPLGLPDATVPWGIESGQVSGGDVNLFRYAGNNPVNRNDPGGQDMINDPTIPIAPLPPGPAVPLTPPLHKAASTPAPLPMLTHPLLHPALAGIKHQLSDPSITQLPQSLTRALLYKPSLPALPSNALARQIYAAELAYLQSHSAAPEQMIILGATPHAIGAPGFWTSLIPIYGSGRAAINDYQTGHWGWGIFDTAMAVSDIFLVRKLAIDVGEVGGKVLIRLSADTVEESPDIRYSLATRLRRWWYPTTGHHAIFPRRWNMFPNFILHGRLNVIRPFEDPLEYARWHFRVDPNYFGGRFRNAAGELITWSAKEDEGNLVKYGIIGRLWHGSPSWLFYGTAATWKTDYALTLYNRMVEAGIVPALPQPFPPSSTQRQSIPGKWPW
jgi:RHS repeat-associated protein